MFTCVVCGYSLPPIPNIENFLIIKVNAKRKTKMFWQSMVPIRSQLAINHAISSTFFLYSISSLQHDDSIILLCGTRGCYKPRLLGKQAVWHLILQVCAIIYIQL